MHILSKRPTPRFLTMNETWLTHARSFFVAALPQTNRHNNAQFHKGRKTPHQE
jgi:hypothetical protein